MFFHTHINSRKINSISYYFTEHKSILIIINYLYSEITIKKFSLRILFFIYFNFLNIYYLIYFHCSKINQEFLVEVEFSRNS
jgi:hypothetical protein